MENRHIFHLYFEEGSFFFLFIFLCVCMPGLVDGVVPRGVSPAPFEAPSKTEKEGDSSLSGLVVCALPPLLLRFPPLFQNTKDCCDEEEEETLLGPARCLWPPYPPPPIYREGEEKRCRQRMRLITSLPSHFDHVQSGVIQAFQHLFSPPSPEKRFWLMCAHRGNEFSSRGEQAEEKYDSVQNGKKKRGTICHLIPVVHNNEWACFSPFFPCFFD